MPLPSPEDLPNPGIEPTSPTLQMDSLLSERPGSWISGYIGQHFCRNQMMFCELWLSFLDGACDLKVTQSCLTLCDPMDSPWNSPCQSTGDGSLSCLQGIFPTQGSNSGLQHCRWILYQLSHWMEHELSTLQQPPIPTPNPTVLDSSGVLVL